MRAIHVIPAVNEEASGPSYSVVRLCESLIGAGVNVQLAALEPAPDRARLPYLETFPLGIGPRRLGVSPAMRRWLRAEAQAGEVDIVHNHSLWMMPNVYPGWACRGTQARLVVSPRGTLSAWALDRSAFQKRLFWHALQAPVLRGARCFHATSEAEYADIRNRGFAQPVFVVPNGVDVPALHPRAIGARRQLLFLGRIHPVKGVDLLLRAWAAVESRFADWDLRIAGPDNDGHLRSMQALATTLRLDRVQFVGPRFGADKLVGGEELTSVAWGLAARARQVFG